MILKRQRITAPIILVTVFLKISGKTNIKSVKIKIHPVAKLVSKKRYKLLSILLV